MVLQKRKVKRMECEGVTLVDSWETYVLCTMHYDERIALTTYWFQSGCREEHAPVCEVFMSLFEAIHNAYQINNH